MKMSVDDDYRKRPKLSVKGMEQMFTDKKWCTSCTKEQYAKILDMIKKLKKASYVCQRDIIKEISLLIWFSSENATEFVVCKEIQFRFDVGSLNFSSKRVCREFGYDV